MKRFMSTGKKEESKAEIVKNEVDLAVEVLDGSCESETIIERSVDLVWQMSMIIIAATYSGLILEKLTGIQNRVFSTGTVI